MSLHPTTALSRRAGRLSLASIVLVASVAAVAVSAVVSSAQQEPALRDQIAVAEARMLVSFPDLTESAAARLRAEDLRLQEDGVLRQITALRKVEPASDPWTVLLYFDGRLSRPETVRRAAAALSAQRSALVELGEVTVVAAGQETVRKLSGSRDPIALELALARVVAQPAARDALQIVRSESEAELPADRLEAEIDLLEERADELVTTALDVCSTPPCALFLVSEGFEPDPRLLYQDQLVADLEIDDHRAITEGVARTLSGHGVVTFGVALERVPDEVPPEQRPNADRGAGTDFEAWKEGTPGVRTGAPRRSPGSWNDVDRDDPLALSLDARLAPLRQWAAATAGTVVRGEAQLAAAIASLAQRWWLVYRTDPMGGEREARPLQVDIAPLSTFREQREWRRRLGVGEADIDVRHPSWSLGFSPRALDLARLRQARRGHTFDDTLGVQTVRDGDDVTLRWSSSRERVTVRISAFGSDGRRPAVRTTTATTQLVQRADELPPGAEGEPSRVVDLGLERPERGWVVVTELETGRSAVVEISR